MSCGVGIMVMKDYSCGMVEEFMVVDEVCMIVLCYGERKMVVFDGG